MSVSASPVLVLACGALARELLWLRTVNQWPAITVQCLPADLHNTPEQIVPRVQSKLDRLLATGVRYRQILLGYGDCGTGGALDRLIEQYRAAGWPVQRLPGAHCYEFYAGEAVFSQLSAEQPGTFYLTDFLAGHFERLVWCGLGLDRHPQLLPVYFAHYQRLVYLSQHDQAPYLQAAKNAAAKLGLRFEHRVSGYGELERGLGRTQHEALC